MMEIFDAIHIDPLTDHIWYKRNTHQPTSNLLHSRLVMWLLCAVIVTECYEKLLRPCQVELVNKAQKNFVL